MPARSSRQLSCLKWRECALRPPRPWQDAKKRAGLVLRAQEWSNDAALVENCGSHCLPPPPPAAVLGLATPVAAPPAVQGSPEIGSASCREGEWARRGGGAVRSTH